MEKGNEISYESGSEFFEKNIEKGRKGIETKGKNFFEDFSIIYLNF